MTVSEILQIVYIAVAFVVGAVPSIIGFVNAAKARKKATTASEKEEAEKDMAAQAKTLIEAAETFYKSLDTMLKQNGESAGSYKKESVMSKLQTYATEKGYTFDSAYWSTKVDELVKFTKSVNAK